MKQLFWRTGVIAVILFSMTGCATKSFQFNQDKEVLFLDQKTHTAVITDEAHHFGHPVDVKRYVLDTDLSKHQLVYEHAVVATGYEFSKSVPYTLKAVFNALKVKTLDYQSGVYLLEIHFRDASTAYAAVLEGVEYSNLKMIYSSDRDAINILFSETVFSSGTHMNGVDPVSVEQDIGIRTHWDYKILFTNKIVTPIHLSPVY